MSYLVAIDGTDASGKATQTERLKERLVSEGYRVRVVSFPDYGSRGCEPVKLYLEGAFGSQPNDTNPYAASTLFAVDRFASFRMNWKADYESDDCVILLNRYTTANAVHQLSKIDEDAEKEAFLTWLFDFEYRKLELPAPDEVIYLEMPTDITLSLLNKRCETTGEKKDIHELDPTHLYRSHAAALYACEKLGWDHIVCGKDGCPRPIDEIHEDVYACFLSKLPQSMKH